MFVKSLGPEVEGAWIQAQALPLGNCVMTGKTLHLSGPQCPQL